MGRAPPQRRIPINKRRRNKKNRKSQLDKHHSNNCCTQDTLMHAKISR